MRRVVVTGIGIVSSIGNNANEVLASLREAKSGVRAAPQYAELGFRCQVEAAPQLDWEAMVDRRAFLAHAALGTAALFSPRMAFAKAAGPRRFVFIIQRGAADGLHIAAPVGDPGFTAMRGAFVEDFATGAKLDGTFTLHPALPTVAKLYGGGGDVVAHSSVYAPHGFSPPARLAASSATGSTRRPAPPPPG